VKGVHSLGSAGCGEKREWRFGTVVRLEPRFGAALCGEWIASGSDLLVDS
jgi:hypothetical protein